MTDSIRILPPEEARRIAAGEVIDRPAALIREFLDNAIDSGASNIEVLVEGGGSVKAEVSDDGRGMSKEDLELCWLPHATSKIRCLDDLDTAETLGFRGEALAAVAAVARLEIVTGTGGGSALRLNVGPGEANPPVITQAGRTNGSTVRALNLFDTLPARKRFLKRDWSEAALCRQAFIEKALAFPVITFRYTQDGKPKDFLPAAASKKDRFAAALLDEKEGCFLHEIHVSGEGFSVDVVFGGPEIFRNDRRMLYVFANGRRIQEYSLMLAMEYGTQGWFPNGTHPVGAVYIDIDPALADFNIHPAKREARFRDPGAISHAISAGLRNFSKSYNIKVGSREWGCGNAAIGSGGQGTGNRDWGLGIGEQGTGIGDRGLGNRDRGLGLAVEALLDNPPAFAPLPGKENNSGYFAGNGNDSSAAEETPVYGESKYAGLQYAGSIFGLFILIEWGDKLFIIDQHAAHERILYNRFLSEPIPMQELLVPVIFSTESFDDDKFLETKREELARLAVVINREENSWRIDALPAGWRLSDTETVKKILDLRNAGENLTERWAATLCCHQAVKDGGYLDSEAALSLAKDVFALPSGDGIPRCPHGRPVWTQISREALCKAVKRS